MTFDSPAGDFWLYPQMTIDKGFDYEFDLSMQCFNSTNPAFLKLIYVIHLKWQEILLKILK